MLCAYLPHILEVTHESAVVTTVAMAGLDHDAGVHGADMLVVMVMRILMVTTVGMAGLVQPV